MSWEAPSTSFAGPDGLASRNPLVGCRQGHDPAGRRSAVNLRQASVLLPVTRSPPSDRVLQAEDASRVAAGAGPLAGTAFTRLLPAWCRSQPVAARTEVSGLV